MNLATPHDATSILPKSKRLVYGGLAGFLAVTGVLLLAELAIRAFDIGPDIYPVLLRQYRLSDNLTLGYEHVPGAVDGDFAFNAHGMRNRDLPFKKPPGTIRIACVGDSVTFGYGVPHAQAYPAGLRHYLDGALPDQRFEVMNAGVTGYSITQVAEFIASRIVPMDPDVILYGYCLNDPHDFSFERNRLTGRLNRAQWRYRKRLLGDVESFAAHSRLYLMLRYIIEAETMEGRWRAMRGNDEEHDVYMDASRTVGWIRMIHAELPYADRLERGLARIGRISHDSGIPVVVVIFPYFRELQPYPLLDVHQRLSELTVAGGMVPLDLRPVFQSAQQDGMSVARDFIHPSPVGHDVAARAIFEFLKSEALIAPHMDQ